MAIIISDGHLKGPDIRPVGDRALLHLSTHALFDMYFAHSTSSLFKMTTAVAAATGGGELLEWLAPQYHSHARVVSDQQRYVDRKSLIRDRV